MTPTPHVEVGIHTRATAVLRGERGTCCEFEWCSIDEGLDKFMKVIDEVIGLDKLVAFKQQTLPYDYLYFRLVIKKNATETLMVVDCHSTPHGMVVCDNFVASILERDKSYTADGKLVDRTKLDACISMLADRLGVPTWTRSDGRSFSMVHIGDKCKEDECDFCKSRDSA